MYINARARAFPGPTSMYTFFLIKFGFDRDF